MRCCEPVSRLAPKILVALVLGGALAARAEDAVSAPPSSSESDDRISVLVRGDAQAIASDMVLEYIVRGEAEDAATAARNYSKRIARVRRALADEAPDTSRVTIELTTEKKVTAAGFVFKLEQNGQNRFKTDPGATFSGRLLVSVRGLATIPRESARVKIAELLGLLADNELTGAEDDVDLMYVHMKVDEDLLRARSFDRAMRRARVRAEALARLSERELGRVLTIRELGTGTNADQTIYGSSYFNFVFPMNGWSWTADLGVSCETVLQVDFELR